MSKLESLLEPAAVEQYMEGHARDTASIAVSLKRIADLMAQMNTRQTTPQTMSLSADDLHALRRR